MTGFEDAILARDPDRNEHLLQVPDDAAGVITVDDDAMVHLTPVSSSATACAVAANGKASRFAPPRQWPVGTTVKPEQRAQAGITGIVP